MLMFSAWRNASSDSYRTHITSPGIRFALALTTRVKIYKAEVIPAGSKAHP
jgi:hypothetical protein